jgi:hypothetical protein
MNEAKLKVKEQEENTNSKRGHKKSHYLSCYNDMMMFEVG